MSEEKQSTACEDERHPLQKWIDEEGLENVRGLKKQLTYNQCCKIITEFQDKKLIADTLLEMENYAPLQKKYRSVYLTLRTWLKRNIKAASDPRHMPKRKDTRGWEDTYRGALAWLQKNQIPESELTEHFEPVNKPDGKVIWRKK